MSHLASSSQSQEVMCEAEKAAIDLLSPSFTLAINSAANARIFLHQLGFACESSSLGLRQLIHLTCPELQEHLGIDRSGSLALHRELSKLHAFVDCEGHLISSDLPRWFSSLLQLNAKLVQKLCEARESRSRICYSFYSNGRCDQVSCAFRHVPKDHPDAIQRPSPPLHPPARRIFRRPRRLSRRANSSRMSHRHLRSLRARSLHYRAHHH